MSGDSRDENDLYDDEPTQFFVCPWWPRPLRPPACQLIIMRDGATVAALGREFWIDGDFGYTTISTRTLPGEPVGVVRVQFPNDAGWTRAIMLDFLSSVHVGAGARPGLG